MPVVYIEGTFKISGLKLKSEQEMDKLLEGTTKAMREAHPKLRFDSDVELDQELSIIKYGPPGILPSS